MNRSDVIEEVARRAGLGASEARRAVQALFGTAPGDGLIADALDRGDKVVLTGFGTFRARARGERRVKDPRDGAWRTVPAGRAVAFRAGIALKDRLR